MRLPNGNLAVIEVQKLVDYCLSFEHPRGRHKARVFQERLGLSDSDAEILKLALLDAANTAQSQLGEKDAYGQRHVIDFELAGPKGKAKIRSSWIVRNNENFPRFVSCYILVRDKK